MSRVMPFFQRVRKWNKERGLLKKGFNADNEAAFIIEEVCESYGIKSKFLPRVIVAWIKYCSLFKEVSKEQRVDAYAGVIVFAAGAIEKLGYRSDAVMSEVMTEVESRSGMLNDTSGKFEKDPNALVYKATFSKCEKKYKGS